MKKFILALTALTALAGCVGKKDSQGGQSNTPRKTSFTDIRDGKTYRTVEIGWQTWTAENMDHETPDSKCYENSPDSCAKYGRLYTWADAKNACPAGWHLPTDEEWAALAVTAGGIKTYAEKQKSYYWETAGKKLKSKTGWSWNDDGNVSGNGTDAYGFSALPGGIGRGNNSGGAFREAGAHGFWWSATEDGAGNAWNRDMGYYYGFVGRKGFHKTALFSVRCVRDN